MQSVECNRRLLLAQFDDLKKTFVRFVNFIGRKLFDKYCTSVIKGAFKFRANLICSHNDPDMTYWIGSEQFVNRLLTKFCPLV